MILRWFLLLPCTNTDEVLFNLIYDKFSVETDRVRAGEGQGGITEVIDELAEMNILPVLRCGNQDK